MANKNITTDNAGKSMRTYLCRLAPLSSFEKEELKFRIAVAIAQTAAQDCAT